MKNNYNSNKKKHRQPDFSRRDFLKLAGAAGTSALFPSCLPWPNQSWNTIPSPSEHRNVIIIGSGFGGAVTALRLAQEGIEATIIEKGKRWEITPEGDTFSPYIYPDARSTWLSNTTVVHIGPPLPINKYVGVLEGHFYSGLRVLTGASYGGGSIVYGGLHVKPPKHLFEHVFPPEIDYDELEFYYQRVGDMLDIGTVPDDIMQTDSFTHFRVMERHNKNAELNTARIYSASDWDIVRDEINGTIKPSIIHGEAIYGVNSGAKNTLDMNYLAQAEQSGFLEVKTLHQVKDIGIDGNDNYLVKIEEINTQGFVINEVVYSCKYLFLAAGSIGTSNLLVKAKEKGFLPDLNNDIGKGWSNNGNTEALRTIIGTSTGTWQGGPPASAVEDYDNPITPLFIEHPQFPLGIDSLSVDSNSLLYFALGINPTKGQFNYNPFSDCVGLSWPKSDNQQQTVNDALLHTMDKLNEANGGQISPLLFGSKGYSDSAVFHPLGGVVMGKACDYFGRIKNYNNLYAIDGSIIPGSTACANPASTIAALAERNVERIIEEDFIDV
jgi:cholesterol oxidase